VKKQGAGRIQEEDLPGGIRGRNWPGGRANLKFALNFLLVDLQFKQYQNVFY